MIQYFFRKPKYPLICEIGDTLIGARSEKRFIEQLEIGDLAEDENYDLVDSTGECWFLMAEVMVVCPTVRIRRTKKQIIELFNGSLTAQKAGLTYPLKSLSNKRLDRIVREIATLLEKCNKNP